ncbi:hypothetical protein ACV07N_15735 [Roseivirga echinicomitans]
MKKTLEILNSWINLDNDQKLTLRESLEDYFKIACKWYAEDLDPFEEYYKFTNDPILKREVEKLGYPIEWNVDLHQSDENYTNFKESLGEIQFDLAHKNKTLFLSIMNWSTDKNLLLIETLEELGL